MTFLLTDIEGSTRLWERAGEAFRAALDEHHRLLRAEFARHGGEEVNEAGDSFVVAFATAGQALACAVAGQQALSSHAAWPEATGPLRVRMALHSGDVEQNEGEYHGIVLHRASRMLTAAHGGQILASEVTAGLLRRGHEDGDDVRLLDLGVYRLRDVPTPERLFQVAYPGMEQTDFGPLNAPAGQETNLPLPITRFFGREQEITILSELLRAPDVRLLTLTGPGGTGKTRLSLEVAQRLAETFEGAVWFAPLADLSDPALIPDAVLDALRLPRSPQRAPLDQVVEHLAKQPAALLVLDNFEHLLGGASATGLIESGGTQTVQALIARVPTLTLLVTSRQLLGLTGEREFSLKPLPTPNGADTPERLSVFDSVRLFIDRAQAAKPDFQVTAGNAPAIAALCDGLEGIPLALELAAARAQVMTPAQMLAGLGHRFDLLVSRKRDVGERQRTLKGAVEWSYRLLSPELQRFFCRLSVFRGGWTAEAAEQVCEEPLALDHLAQLRECSLVLAETSGGDGEADAMRFRMLETLREFAAEQLTAPEAAALAGRHASAFLTLAEEAFPHLRGPDQARWLGRLAAEHENIRVALRCCLNTPGREEDGLRMAVQMSTYWFVRGHLREARGFLDEALQKDAVQAPRQLRAIALGQAGGAAHELGDLAIARDLFGRSVAMYRELAFDGGMAYALANLGQVTISQGDLTAARSYLEEALALFRGMSHEGGIRHCLNILGITALNEGDYGRAHIILEEALTLDEAREDPDRAAMTHNLGVIAFHQGEPDTSRAMFEEALGMNRQTGHRLWEAQNLLWLGILARESGDHGAARSLLAEALSIQRDNEALRGIPGGLEAMAYLAQAQGQAGHSARLLGAAQALRVRLGAPIAPTDEPEHEAQVAQTRERLGESAFAAAWEAGRALTWEQAVAYALEDDPTPGTSAA